MRGSFSAARRQLFAALFAGFLLLFPEVIALETAKMDDIVLGFVALRFVEGYLFQADLAIDMVRFDGTFSRAHEASPTQENLSDSSLVENSQSRCGRGRYLAVN
jgi:hypothetical protein